MRNEDFAQFNDLLEATYALLGRDKMPNATAKALFFRALQHLSFDEVRAGFDAHIKDPTRGRFAPMPADIIAASEGVAANDSRPGAEQAWAMCCRAADEYETVVWTSEMRRLSPPPHRALKREIGLGRGWRLRSRTYSL